jgi:hypothetical protein
LPIAAGIDPLVSSFVSRKMPSKGKPDTKARSAAKKMSGLRAVGIYIIDGKPDLIGATRVE